MENKPASSSKRQRLRSERARKQRQQRITTYLIIAGVALVVVAILAFPTIQRAFAPVGEVVQITPQARPNADFNAMGDPNAPVKIVEYSDFQCPFCKRFADETEGQIVENYIATGKVYFVYIPYGPGGQYIGEESKNAAMAAFCAGDQGKFWEYKDILFANHTGENVGDYTEKRLMTFAEMLALDMEAFSSCYSSNKYADKLQEGIRQGIQAGMGGTPSFLINGAKIEGAQPYEAFKQAIDNALAAAGAN